MKSGIWAVLAAAVLAVSAWGAEPSAEWTMRDSDGIVKNAGTGGSDGDLTLAEGVAFSDDVHVGNTGGTALRISGDDPTAAAETEATFDPFAAAEKFTIMAWVRRESASASDNQSARILADHDGSNGVEFKFGGAPGFLMLKVNGEEVWTTEGLIMPNNGTWRHVAVVYDSTRPATNAATRNVHFYIDGIQKGYGSALDDIPGANSSPVAIGNASASRSSASQLVGSIDDVFVFADWAPEPSGNGNLNTEIRDWMLIDDSTRIPEDEPEPDEDWNVPPVMVGDVIAQKWGEERNYEELAEGLIFVNAETGDLWYANEENPHGRAICVCKPFPNWHRFQDTVWFLGHVLQLNDHYSMQAEAHTLSIRYGGEAVWRILGDEGGDLAGILTVEVEDENHLLIQANATGTNVALQVCTNLMEATPWKTAENAVIYTQTDAATTWRATLFNTDGFSGVELYRVLNGNNPRPAGVYCERPLRANRGIVVPDGQSISLGGVERYDWQDTSGIAENRLAIGAVATNLATHAGRTDNPHNVTASQIGALTNETDSAALAALAAHTGDTTNNPHSVTAEQTGALPLTGGTLNGSLHVNSRMSQGNSTTGDGSFSHAEGSLTTASGYAAHAEGESTTASGNFSHADGNRAIASNQYAYAWSGQPGASTYGSHGDGSFNVNPAGGETNFWVGEKTLTELMDDSVFAVSGRVSTIESDYVQAADIAGFATTGDVASVERRIGAIETNTATWIAESWTFVLTNGTSVAKSVIVAGGN